MVIFQPRYTERTYKTNETPGIEGFVGSLEEIPAENQPAHSPYDIFPQLREIPPEPDILGQMRSWLERGTLARIGRGREFQYSPGLWCVDLPQFARRLIARIDAQDEGEFTWQRLELAYWTVRCWMEEGSGR